MEIVEYFDCSHLTFLFFLWLIWVVNFNFLSFGRNFNETFHDSFLKYLCIKDVDRHSEE